MGELIHTWLLVNGALISIAMVATGLGLLKNRPVVERTREEMAQFARSLMLITVITANLIVWYSGWSP